LDTAEHGTVAAIDVAATVSDDSGAVFLVKRDPGHALEVEIRLQNLPPIGAARHVLTDDDLTVRNTRHDPNRVLLDRGTLTPASDRWLNVTLPPASWNMVTFSSAG
jgi:alpha-L-arabinofuranosidase